MKSFLPTEYSCKSPYLSTRLDVSTAAAVVSGMSAAAATTSRCEHDGSSSGIVSA